jgi:hypothetical protein
LESTEFTKIIGCTNFKAQSNELASKIRGHLNDTALPGNVIHVDGDLVNKQKSHHNIKIFLPHGKIGNPKEPDNPFDPLILVAKSGAANAGVNYLVLRAMDFLHPLRISCKSLAVLAVAWHRCALLA